MYKLPPLSVFISEAEKSYELMSKMGLVGKITWEEHVHFIKAMYQDMKKMDPLKLDEFIITRSRQRVAVLKSFDSELDKTIGALNARKNLEESARSVLSGHRKG